MELLHLIRAQARRKKYTPHVGLRCKIFKQGINLIFKTIKTECTFHVETASSKPLDPNEMIYYIYLKHTARTGLIIHIPAPPTS